MAFDNTRNVGHGDGCMRINVLAENATTGITTMYSIVPSLLDEGLSFSSATLKGKVKETGVVHTCDGEVAGVQSGNKKYEEKTMDFVLGDDFNLVKDNVDATLSRNILIAMVKGESFIDAGATQIIIGVNGVRYIVALTNDLDTKYLLLEDGKLINPNKKNADGTMAVTANNIMTSQKDASMIMLEVLYAYDDNSKSGSRLPYFLTDTDTFNEGSGTDFNKINVSGARYSDNRAIDRYFIDGNSNPQPGITILTGTVTTADSSNAIVGVGTAFDTEVLVGDMLMVGNEIKTVATVTDATNLIMDSTYNGADAGVSCSKLLTGDLKEINATYIIEIASVLAPTITGELGDIVALVDTDDGSVSLYINTTGANVWVALTQTIAQGAKIFAPKTDTAIDGASSVDENVYMAIKTAGTTGNAIAVNWKTKSTGSGVATYTLGIKNWSYATSAFVTYTV